MSKISLASNANGTGIFTLASPATNTNRTLTLPDSTGTLLDTNGGTITGTLTVTGVTTLGNGAILGTPASVGTMPAFTLGGTVSGGGNNINNVVIGASSPLAGSFTTVSATTTLGVTGAATLSSTLDVTGNVTIRDDTLNTPRVLTFSANATSAGNYGTIRFGNTQNVNNNASIVGSVDVNLYDGKLTFSTTPTGGSITERMRISSTGTVSGGTSSTGFSFSGSAPAGSLALDSSGKLDVVRSSTNTGAFSEPEIRAINSGAATLNQRIDIGMRFQDGVYNGIGGISMVRESATDNSGSLVLCPIDSSGNPLEAVVINSAGNLGLGVTPSAWFPSYRSLSLGYSSNGMFSGASTQLGVNTNAYLDSGVTWRYTTSNPASQYVQSSGAHLWFSAPSGTAGDAITFTQAMTLDASGNLGVGTSSPGASLSVVKAISAGNIGTSFQQELVNNNSANVGDWTGTIYRFLPNNANTNQAYIGAIVTTNAGDTKSDLVFGVKNSSSGNTIVEAMRISSGNLLVGNTQTDKGVFTVYNNATSFASVQAFAYLKGTQAGDVSMSGLVIAKFDNNSTSSQILVRFAMNNAAHGQGQINGDGAGAAAFGSYSDSRLKENIVDLPNQLNNILALRPVEFDYIESEGGGHQIGFIAQEMQEVYPDVVGARDPDSMLTITGWSKTEARLVKAIQEQQALITQLTARITALETA